jgi:HEAT repeat protein
MKRTAIILGGVVVLASAIAVWWLTRPERNGAPKSLTAGAPSPPVERGTAPSPNPEGNPTPAPSPAAQAAQTGNPPAGPDATAVRSAALKASVMAALADMKKLYGYAGALSWDDAKALIARRKQETKAMEDRLAALGAGGAAAIAAAYNTTDDLHAKLMLVHALGMIQDDAADATLQSLLAGESTFSLQREIVAALGERHDPASVAILSQIAANQADSQQLRFAAVQSLAGQPSALPALTQLFQTETNPDVQKQMIVAIGATHNDAAQSALAGVAEGNADIDIRQTAIQELARDFGAGALGVFQQMLNDPNEAIRQNAVTALAQVPGDQAVALLQRTAASDSSEQVRAKAQAALLAATVQ